MRQLIIVLLLLGSASAQSSLDQGLQAAQRQDYVAAKKFFSQAALDQPGDPRPLFNLGLTHAKLSNDTAAMAWFEAYLAAAPNAENAAQVRAQITQLRQSATAKLEKLFASAEAGVAQLTPEQRRSSESSIRYRRESTLDLLKESVDDDTRSKYAYRLVEIGDGEAAFRTISRMKDAYKKDTALAGNAPTLARSGNGADARRFVASIAAADRRQYAQKEVELILSTKALEQEAEQAIRGRDAQKAMAALSQLLPAQITSTDAARWVRELSQQKMFAQAESLVARVTRVYWITAATGDIAAWQLRHGDINAARATARRMLQRYPVPRNDWINLEDALLKAEHGDIDGGLRVIANRIQSPWVKAEAAGAMEHLFTYRLKNEAAKLRVQRMRQSMPQVERWDQPSPAALQLAAALTGEWQLSFALARVAESMGIYGYSFFYDGWVADGMNNFILPGGPYATIALIATLDRKNDVVKRVREELSFGQPLDNTVAMTNTVWAHVISGKLEEAQKALPQIPGNGEHAALSRAQVVSAIAHRYAWSGRPVDGLRTLKLMPAPQSARQSWPVIVLLHTQAAAAVAKAFANARDAVQADATLAAAADFMKKARADASLQALLAGRWTNEKLEAAEAVLRREDPKAAERLGTSVPPAVQLWSALAYELSAETPEEKLKEVSQRSDLKADMPTWLSMTGQAIFDHLIRIDMTARRAAAAR